MDINKPRLTYYDISPCAVAFSTTRHGGCSQGPHATFNINRYCGDTEQCVSQNRKRLADILGIDEKRIVVPHQTHGTQIRLIANDFFELPDNVRDMILDGVDAVMTSESDVCIGVSTADCIPVVIYDSEHHAACVVHAGWRGTVARIVMKAVGAMSDAFHSRPQCLKAVIGPGISLDCFEVGDEVYREFASAGFDMARIARRYEASGGAGRHEKWHIDLCECNRLQLIGVGVDDENIFMSGICTYKNVDDYFSARRLSVNSGRIYTGVVLRPLPVKE